MATLYNNMVIQEQAMMPILLNQKPRFSDSHAPQELMSTMSPDEIINKTKEMYIIYNSFIVFLGFNCICISD